MTLSLLQHWALALWRFRVACLPCILVCALREKKNSHKQELHTATSGCFASTCSSAQPFNLPAAPCQAGLFYLLPYSPALPLDLSCPMSSRTFPACNLITCLASQLLLPYVKSTFSICHCTHLLCPSTSAPAGQVDPFHLSTYSPYLLATHLPCLRHSACPNPLPQVKQHCEMESHEEQLHTATSRPFASTYSAALPFNICCHRSSRPFPSFALLACLASHTLPPQVKSTFSKFRPPPLSPNSPALPYNRTPQVKQSCEMESHEEKLHKMIIQSKINDTKDIMKRNNSAAWRPVLYKCVQVKQRCEENTHKQMLHTATS
jgi:hypothetical protein